MHSRGPELRKFVAPEIIFGVGALHLAGQYGRNLGGCKALVVSDPGVLAAGWVQQVLASVRGAGLESTLFTRVTPNPRIEEVAAGAVVYAEQGCDIIIAVGGGSAIDCAKCIGLLAANQGGIRDFVGVDNVGAPMPPTICIPTTAETSADVSQFAVITNREINRKLLIISKALVPDISLIDPATITTMDAFLTACTGMDALVHAVEAYVSLGHSREYFTDRYASKAGKKIRNVTKKSLDLLQSYPWPGNIRELQNVIERSVIVCETETLSVDESWLSRASVPTAPTSQPLSEPPVTDEKQVIEAALAKTRGRVSGPSGAAVMLAMPASTLESKIRALKIDKYRFKI